MDDNMCEWSRKLPCKVESGRRIMADSSGEDGGIMGRSVVQKKMARAKQSTLALWAIRPKQEVDAISNVSLPSDRPDGRITPKDYCRMMLRW